MAEPTLVSVFGPNATQNATDIVIKKADLVAAGLTPGATNTAESLLASIFIFAANNLTEANRFTDQVNRNIGIEYAATDIIDDGISGPFLRRAWSFMVYTDFDIPVFQADDI